MVCGVRDIMRSGWAPVFIVPLFCLGARLLLRAPQNRLGHFHGVDWGVSIAPGCGFF